MQNLNNSLINQEYKSRINKVFDYIEKNISNKFTLEELAEKANFSKFHFNRIFSSLVGETPFQFITRVRLEKAASMLVVNNKMTISEISEICGFSDMAVFGRAFKNYFKKSATNWKSEIKHTNSNLSQTISNFNQTQSNINQSEDAPTLYFCRVNNKFKWRSNMKIVKDAEVVNLPEMTVAYVRYVGAYQGNGELFAGLFNKLFTWAGPKGLMQQPDLKIICVYHDSPDITEPEKLRTSVCLTVPSTTKTDGEIGKMQITGGEYLVTKFEVNEKEFQQAWEWVYGKLLPASGYQPDDGPCFEMYSEPYNGGKMITEICVPVKPI
jgi:AraC family transcriptional regulator